MRIDVRKHWKCVCWVGPQGECGHGLWRPSEEFVQDAQWCAGMNAAYPGWEHRIWEQKGTPRDLSPTGWSEHPFYGNMQSGPFGL